MTAPFVHYLVGRSPNENFGSVPAMRRAMLPRCITATSMNVKIARMSRGVDTDSANAHTGIAAAAHSDASEAKRNSAAASRYTASAIASTRQSIISATAAPVDTAFPPRK